MNGSISPEGAFTGTVVDSATGSPFLGLTGAIAGTVSSSGQISNGTISYLGHNVITFSGTLTKSSEDVITGTLAAVFTPTASGSTPQNGTISLTLYPNL